MPCSQRPGSSIRAVRHLDEAESWVSCVCGALLPKVLVGRDPFVSGVRSHCFSSSCHQRALRFVRRRLGLRESRLKRHLCAVPRHLASEQGLHIVSRDRSCHSLCRCVRWWDCQGRVSEYENGGFKTALASDGWDGAKWIGAPSKSLFRRRFSVDGSKRVVKGDGV